MMPTARFLLGKRNMNQTYECAVVRSGALSACLRQGADLRFRSFARTHPRKLLLQIIIFMFLNNVKNLSEVLGKFWESFGGSSRSEEHTSELQSQSNLV